MLFVCMRTRARYTCTNYDNNNKKKPKKIKMDRKIRTVAVVMAWAFLRFFARAPVRI